MPPRTLDPRIPVDVEHVVLALLVKGDHRIASAAAVRAMLKQIAGGERVTDPRVMVPVPATLPLPGTEYVPQVPPTVPLAPTPPVVRAPPLPSQTGRKSRLGWWLGGGAVAAGGIAIGAWAVLHAPAPAAPGARFAIVAGAQHSCVLGSDRKAACWGDNEAGQTTAPAQPFVQITAGSYHTCGLREDHTVVCWGIDSDGRGRLSGTFSRIAAGGYHTCGLVRDGTIVCNGDNKDGQATAPEGRFVDVGAGTYDSCGVRTPTAQSNAGDARRPARRHRPAGSRAWPSASGSRVRCARPGRSRAGVRTRPGRRTRARARSPS